MRPEQSKDSAAEELFGVEGLEAVEAVPEKRGPTSRSILAVVSICVAVPLLLAGIGVLAWNQLVVPKTDRGTCFAADPTRCISLSSTTIESLADVVLPQGSQILDSGSQTGPQEARAWAVVQLPQDTALELTSEYQGSDPLTEVPTFGSRKSFLEEAGFASLTEVHTAGDSTGYRKVYVGQGEDRATLVYLMKWQGHADGLFDRAPTG